MFYSKSTNGFYNLQIHGAGIPNDAVEITQDLYNQLLAGQSAGFTIIANEEGLPSLAEKPSPTYKQILDSLNVTYQADVAKLNNAFALTLLAAGPTEDAKIATIRSQYETRKTQQVANIAALKLEYGI